ncbi:hypothetical protein M5K25_024177 [Dendrobium thyrsiflorum]|uniref:Uncharacterized protein n=1 Tax=Dendrobium thyrsiflorum TaxID=117978 RepID=A0ABD0U1M8_DENTH
MQKLPDSFEVSLMPNGEHKLLRPRSFGTSPSYCSSSQAWNLAKLQNRQIQGRLRVEDEPGWLQKEPVRGSFASPIPLASSHTPMLHQSSPPPHPELIAPKALGHSLLRSQPPSPIALDIPEATLIAYQMIYVSANTQPPCSFAYVVLENIGRNYLSTVKFVSMARIKLQVLEKDQNKQEIYGMHKNLEIYGLEYTHSTRLSSPRGCEESTGFLPVMSSKRTTPKEKTSDFSVSLPVDAYSGAKYLERPKVQI